MRRSRSKLLVGPHTTSHTTEEFVTEPHKEKKITDNQRRELALSFQFLILSWMVRILEYAS